MSDTSFDIPEEPKRPSILGDLKARRDEIASNLHTDLRVPHWDEPEIFVRYGPVDHAVISKAVHAIESFKASSKVRTKAEFELNTNIDLIARGCIGVYARLDGEDYSLNQDDPKGPWTLFDGDLATNLGLGEDANARQVVRALFLAEGDILSHAREVMEFSGYRLAETDEQMRGES